jgi:predicted ATPase
MPRTRPSLRFTHLLAVSWRNFVKAEVALAERLIVAGPSGAGKSNLLDAFRFFSDLAAPGGGFQRAVESRGGVHRIRCLAARHEPDVCLAVRAGDTANPARWEYEIHFNQQGRCAPAVQRERLSFNGEELVARPDDADRADSERLEHSALEYGAVGKEAREFARFLGTVRYVHPAAALLRDAAVCPVASAQPHGAGLIARMAAVPERTRQSRLRAILEESAGALPGLRQLEAGFDAQGVAHLRARIEHWRPNGAWLDERHLPDGTLRLIVLMWAALEGAGPLLAEEPEISLHTQVARLAPRILSRLARRSGCQLILTTHSLDVLLGQGVEAGEIVLASPGSDGSTLWPVLDLNAAAGLLRSGSLEAREQTAPPELQLGLF